jgi:hypothetical protein
VKKLALLLSLCATLIITAGCVEKQPMNDQPEKTAESAVKIDIDFTRLSATMQSAQLENIMNDMPGFIGQTFKIRGVYDPYFYPEEQRLLHEIMIECTSGCPKYLEISFISDAADDYPEIGTMIELTGVFGTYFAEGLNFNKPYLTIKEIVIV